LRVPYLKETYKVSKERLNYIVNTCGGSTGVYAGAVFWLIASFISLFASEYIATSFYIFGGAIIVPVLSIQLLKIKNKNKADGEYQSLTIISNMSFIIFYPIALIVQQQIPEYVPMVIALINAAHLLIFMWIHMEFLYCILVGIYFIVAMGFVFTAPDYIFNYLGFVLCVINLVFAILIEKSSKQILNSYETLNI
jgi:hypothetical protein